MTANGLALRSIAIEFGPAEVVDSLLIRPLAFYLGPILFGSMVAGWIFAKLVADVGFYVLAIFSYERFKGLLAVRRVSVRGGVRMDPQRRSRLRDELRGQAQRHGWDELRRRPRHPAAGARPLSGGRAVFDAHRAPAWVSVALRGQGPSAPRGADGRWQRCGSGFDVATTAEVDLPRSLGIPMDRCIHTHPVKKPADIDHAYAHGIRTFVVDNPVEAQKFVGRPSDIELLVRLAFPNPSAKSDLSTKFGVDPAEAELLVKHVVAAGVRFAGFSFHVGSQGTSVQPYRDALRATLDLTSTSSGRWGCACRSSTSAAASRWPTARTCRRSPPSATVVDEVLGVAPGRLHAMLAEPGRIPGASCMTLLTSVVGTATRDGKVWHYLDDGLYGSYSNVLTEDVHPPILALDELRDGRSADLEPVTLAGPTCDSVDVVARDYPMPSLRPSATSWSAR